MEFSSLNESCLVFIMADLTWINNFYQINIAFI